MKTKTVQLIEDNPKFLWLRGLKQKKSVIPKKEDSTKPLWLQGMRDTGNLTHRRQSETSVVARCESVKTKTIQIIEDNPNAAVVKCENNTKIEL